MSVHVSGATPLSSRALAVALAAISLAAPAAAGRFVASDGAKPPRERLARALDFARRDGRRPLVLFRKQDCRRCDRIKATLTAHEEIEHELVRYFVIVNVDVSRPDGAAIAKEMGADLRLGVPLFTILDDAGRPVGHQETGIFERGEEYDPAKLMAFFRQWEPPRKDASAVYREAFARASASGKRLLVVLGTPFCPGCYAIADVLDGAAVKAILGKEVAVVKIDIDRMQGGMALARRLGFPEEGGVPWLAIVDGSGRLVANMGSRPEDYISPFRLIELGSRGLTQEELGTLSEEMGAWGGVGRSENAGGPRVVRR